MKRYPIFLAVFILFWISCDSNIESNILASFDHKTFTEQRQLWQDSNTMNYTYTLSATGFIFYYGDIFVENGIFKNDIPHDEYSDIDYFINYSTIDEIYQTVENMYNEIITASKSDFYFTDILVTYDKENHIPTKIIYTYFSSPDLAVDGTFFYEISNFIKTGGYIVE